MTPLAITDVTLTYHDNDTTPGDVTFSDLTCERSLVEGSLFFTDPATLVRITTNVVFPGGLHHQQRRDIHPCAH